MKHVSSLLACVFLYFILSYNNCVFGAETSVLLLKLKNSTLTDHLLSPQKESESLLSVYDKDVIRIMREFDVMESVRRLSKLPAMKLWIQVTILNNKKESFIERIRNNREVDVIEQLPEYHLFATPNDFDPKQWSLTKISAEAAWDISKGKSSIRVAIVDDAVDISHPDLKPAIWKNTGEIEGNNIDDDNNGYIDDIYGWDAADNDNNPHPPSFASTSEFSHGTHCAGIAAAATDNSIGIASIGYGISIIPVKTKLDATTGKSLTHVFQGVEYAIVSKADIISMSWGGGGFSSAFQELFNEAHRQGIVLIAAAGNDNISIPMFPASYNHVIAVAATSSNDKKAWFSNYGDWVDVAAPGVDIYSTVPGNERYAHFSGTSMACPLVAGLAGLMKSRNPFAEPDDIELCLKESCEDIHASNPDYINLLGSGRINALNAVLCVKPGPPRTNFAANFQRVCTGKEIIFYDRSKGTPATSWKWTFVGAIPAFSSEQNPIVSYSVNGIYDVTLIACNEYGCDTIVKKAYITVAPPKATLVLNGRDSVCEYSHAFLELLLEGNPPWSVQWSDGKQTFTENGIRNNNHFIQINPSDTNIYSIISVRDSLCEGIIQSGTKKFTLINCSGTPPRSDAIWYFGEYAGIDFNHDKPVPLLNSVMDTFEGCATISDDHGNLLFYTDGITVWNKNHKPMPNGKNLKGNSSSTQSAIIVPDPSSKYKYYLFTVAIGFEDKFGLYYSIVDIRLDGGRGNVTSVKNVFMMNEASEKVSATWHNNKKDIWIMSFERYTNTYYSFLLTDKGVGKSIKTSIGRVMTEFNPHGYLRFSHDGSMVAMGFGYDKLLQLCRFDNKTGKPSLWLTLSGDDFFPYGLEFSPDDSKLYVGNHQHSNIYQFDLKAGSDADIVKSGTKIGSASIFVDALQLAPDGKIYAALFHSDDYNYPYLGVVSNPNEKNASFIEQGFYLGGKNSRNGLPNFLEGFRQTTQQVLANNDTVICLGKTAQLHATMKENTKCSYFWKPLDGLNDGYIRSPLATPNKTTKYIVTAIDPTGLRFHDSVTVFVDSNCCKSAPPKADFITNATTLCLGDSIILNNTSIASSTAIYSWNFGKNAVPESWSGFQPPNIAYNVSGSYRIRLIIEDSCGKDSLEHTIAIFNAPNSRGKYDTIFCSSAQTAIKGEYIPGYSVLWSPTEGLSDSTIPNPNLSLKAGLYTYILRTTHDISGCMAYDTLTVKIADTPLSFTLDTLVCSAKDIKIGRESTKGYSYRWFPTTGLADSSASYTTVSMSKGKYLYLLHVTDTLTGCNVTDSIIIAFDEKPIVKTSPDTIICLSTQANLHAEGGIYYQWFPSEGLNNPTIPNPIATPSKTTTYNVIVSGEYGCMDSASVNVEVIPNSRSILKLLTMGNVIPGDTASIVLTFEIPNDIPEGNGITSFDIIIEFDSTAIFPLPERMSQNGSLRDWVIQTSILSGGKIRISGTGEPMFYKGEYQFGTLVLLPSVPAIDTFQLRVASWKTIPDNVCTGISASQGGGITYSAICASMIRGVKSNGLPFGIKSVNPNPAQTNNTTVHFFTGLDAYTDLSVYTVFGEIVQTPMQQWLRAGEYSWNLDTHTLSTGVYIIRLHSGPYKEEILFMKE